MQAIEEGKGRFAALSFVIDSEGRILFVWNRRYQCWGLPGGKVEDGESLEAAQARELLEETGLETVSRRLIYEADSVTGTGRRVFVYHVKVQGVARKMEADSPIAWGPKYILLASKFSDFYRGMFMNLGDWM